MRTEPMFANHRWSGWPGAICLYCGQEDPMELELAGVGDGQPTKCPASKATKMKVDNVMNPDAGQKEE